MNLLSQRTLVFLIKGQQVLLGYKKTGFGQGNYLGIGGKVEVGESIEQAAMRELSEESNVIEPLLSKVGELTFIFPKKPSWSQQVHVYLCEHWNGNPQETEEIKPEWFNLDQLPLTKMWDDAQFWLPAILSEHSLKGEFIFNDTLKVTQLKLQESRFHD